MKSNNEGLTLAEIKEGLDMLKVQGNTDENILKVMYMWYVEDQMPLETLEAICGLLGWEFTDEFKAMREEDKKTKGLTGIDLVAYRKKFHMENELVAGMTKAQVMAFIQGQKDNGLDEEEIMKTVYAMFCAGNISFSDMIALADILGYELSEEALAIGEEGIRQTGLDDLKGKKD